MESIRIICIRLGVVTRGQVENRVHAIQYASRSKRRERLINQPARVLKSGNYVGGGEAIRVDAYGGSAAAL